MRASKIAAVALVMLIGVVPPSHAASEGSPGTLPDYVAQLTGALADNHTAYIASGILLNGSYSDAILRVSLADATTTRVGTIPANSTNTTGGRQFAGSAFIAGKYYIFGGLGGTSMNTSRGEQSFPVDFSDIIEYDPASGQTVRLQDKLPYPLFSTTVVAYHDKAYLLGGTSLEQLGAAARGDGTLLLQTVIEFDPSQPAGSRDRVLPALLPTPLASAGGAVVDGIAYLAGGRGDDSPVHPCPTGKGTACNSDLIVAYDLRGGHEGEIVGHLPVPLNQVGVVELGGQIFMAGGINASQGVQVSISRFDPRDQIVTRAPFELPVSLYGEVLVSNGTQAWSLGGYEAKLSYMTRAIAWYDWIFPPSRLYPPTVKARETGGWTLEWHAPQDDGGGTPVYRVWRDTGAGPVEIGETRNLTWTDPVSVASASYRVSARSGQDEGPTSDITRVQTGFELGGAPLLSATGGESAIQLSWSGEPLRPGTNYTVYRDASPVTSVPANTTSWTDDNVTVGATHTYAVRVSSITDGPLSNVISATTGNTPPPPRDVRVTTELSPPEDASVIVTWDPIANATAYSIYLFRDEQTVLLGNVTSAAWNTTVPLSSREVTIAIASQGTTGPGLLGAPVSINLPDPPGAPTVVAAGTHDGKVELQWGPPNPTPAGNLTYRVLRIGSNGIPYVIFDNVRTTQILDTPPTSGKYGYIVQVVTPAEGALSSQQNVTVAARVNTTPITPDAASPTPDATNASGDVVAIQLVSQDGLLATLKANASGALPLTFVWSWGDGSASTGEIVTHHFASGGNRTVTLTWTTPNGTTSQVTRVLTLDDTTNGNAPASSNAIATHRTPAFQLSLLVAIAAAVALVQHRRRAR